MKKEKIEDIFSSIENFSSVPPPELWAKIEEKLDKPKKKKGTAIWWSLAASLLIGLAITSGLYFNSNEDDLLKNNNVVIDNQENNSKSNTTPSTIFTNPLDSTLTIAEPNNSRSNEKRNNNQGSTKTATPSINKKEKSSLKLNNEAIAISKPSTESSTKTTSSERNSIGIDNAINKNKNEKIASNSKSNIDLSTKEGANTSLSKQNNTEVDNNFNRNKNEEIVLNSNTQSSSQNNNNSATYRQNATELNGSLKTDQNKGISVNVSSEKNLIVFNDSLNKVKIALELQQLENRLNNKEDKDEPKTEKVLLEEKWSVGLYAGIVNSQSSGNKKALGNSIESKQNSGYGIKTNYKLNKKWAVSSGLKINELGQSVANVSYYNKQQNTLSTAIINDFFISSPNVEYISTNKNYVFSSDNSNQKVQNSSNNLTGNISQQLQYLEMPLEVSYSILSTKKTAIMLNTGGFVGKLISNEIFLDGNSIGENLDVNNFVYGSKLSSTLQYEVLKQTRLFVEPGLNYYVNPLKTQSFNQFQWGLNFGVNFGF